MVNESNTDIVKLAMASLMASLSIVLFMAFINYGIYSANTGEEGIGGDVNTIWINHLNTFDKMINRYKMEKTGCLPSEEQCNTDIRTIGGINLNFVFDIMATLLNIGKAITFIVTIVGLTILLPIILSTYLTSYTTNPFLIAIITLASTLWFMLQGWLLWRILFTKRA